MKMINYINLYLNEGLFNVIYNLCGPILNTSVNTTILISLGVTGVITIFLMLPTGK